MSRIFDRTLKCGCMVSSDGGGGVIPCHYDSDPKQSKKCAETWAKWKKTKDYQKHLKEIQERNK